MGHDRRRLDRASRRPTDGDPATPVRPPVPPAVHGAPHPAPAELRALLRTVPRGHRDRDPRRPESAGVLRSRGDADTRGDRALARGAERLHPGAHRRDGASAAPYERPTTARPRAAPARTVGGGRPAGAAPRALDGAHTPRGRVPAPSRGGAHHARRRGEGGRAAHEDAAAPLPSRARHVAHRLPARHPPRPHPARARRQLAAGDHGRRGREAVGVRPPRPLRLCLPEPLRRGPEPDPAGLTSVAGYPKNECFRESSRRTVRFGRDAQSHRCRPRNGHRRRTSGA
ncbi:hypothetical protein PLANTIT3_20102 [Plantibacter sp. T3]|nr:hypothetical protein PLANTIT3_20102 [Plantibacter sp. T3]